MGLEDRDWFREETARKKGMVYNRKNATYSADPRYFPKQFRGSRVVPEHRQDSGHVRPPKKYRFLLQFSITISICGFVFVALKIISQLLR